MKKVIIVMVYLLFVVSVGWADTFGSGENQFTIDFVDIALFFTPLGGFGMAIGAFTSALPDLPAISKVSYIVGLILIPS